MIFIDDKSVPITSDAKRVIQFASYIVGYLPTFRSNLQDDTEAIDIIVNHAKAFYVDREMVGTGILESIADKLDLKRYSWRKLTLEALEKIRTENGEDAEDETENGGETDWNPDGSATDAGGSSVSSGSDSKA